jgi:hypothetical protein
MVSLRNQRLLSELGEPASGRHRGTAAGRPAKPDRPAIGGSGRSLCPPEPPAVPLESYNRCTDDSTVCSGVSSALTNCTSMKIVDDRSAGLTATDTILVWVSEQFAHVVR